MFNRSQNIVSNCLCMIGNYLFLCFVFFFCCCHHLTCQLSTAHSSFIITYISKLLTFYWLLRVQVILFNRITHKRCQYQNKIKNHTHSQQKTHLLKDTHWRMYTIILLPMTTGHKVYLSTFQKNSEGKLTFSFGHNNFVILWAVVYCNWDMKRKQ